MKKQYNITNEQVERIRKRYGKLIFMIAHRIGGDPSVNSFDDSVQELYISACDACEAYGRKLDLEFEDFFDTNEFHKYIKSCLWNKKNNTGRNITKKKILNNSFSLDEDLFGDESIVTEAFDVSALLSDVRMNPECKQVLRHLLNDFSLVKPNGNLNVSKLSRVMDKDKKQTKALIDHLQNIFKDYNEGYDNA